MNSIGTSRRLRGHTRCLTRYGPRASTRSAPGMDRSPGRSRSCPYQLLKGEVPTGSTAIRTGNPDGGVEWYANQADGSEWGWQAKHVHGIDALLGAMTESVTRVVRDRPKLVRTDVCHLIEPGHLNTRRIPKVAASEVRGQDSLTGWRQFPERQGSLSSSSKVAICSTSWPCRNTEADGGSGGEIRSYHRTGWTPG